MRALPTLRHPPVGVLYAIILALLALVFVLVPIQPSHHRTSLVQYSTALGAGAADFVGDPSPYWKWTSTSQSRKESEGSAAVVDGQCNCHCGEPLKKQFGSHKSSKPKHPKEPMDPFEYWSLMALVVFLVLLGGMFADETNLSILMKSGTPTEKMYAERIAPIRRDSHLLLVTLLLANTVVNETLPVLLGILDLEGYQAVIFSTALIVVFGEIIPQAVCARYGLQVGAFLAWPVRIMIWLVYIVAYPIAKLLDYVLGHKGAIVYRRAQLKEFVAMHGEDHEGPLTEEEVTILRAVLELRDKTVVNIMTKIEDVVMMPLSSKLDRPTMHHLLQAGHSRVPVFNQFRDNIIGVVLVKQLVLLDPDDATPLADVPIGRLPRIRSDTPLFEILHVFEEGGSHMAVVVEEIPLEDNAIGSIITSSPLWVSNSPVLNARRFRTLGIVTLEDVIEEMIGQEIVDETDVYVDVGGKVKVARAFHEMERRLAKAGLIKGNGGSVPASPYLSVGEDTITPLSPPPLPHTPLIRNTESTPLLHPSHTPILNHASSSTSLHYGTHASPSLGPISSNSPLLEPMNHANQRRPSRRRKDPLVPAALLVEEETWRKPPSDLCGLRIHGAGVDDEKLHAPPTPTTPIEKGNKAEIDSVVRPAHLVSIERDEDGIVVDGKQFLPNDLDLDNSSHRSSTSSSGSSSSDREIVIDVEVSHKPGSLENLD
ncbi:hypothetical protein HDU67_000032 [Dinochytrium kinnereticum]|nr:hypothetical protein HDU67_000032 [Dinochytrium kinnereticum]